jgi:hypothetical protein
MYTPLPSQFTSIPDIHLAGTSFFVVAAVLATTYLAFVSAHHITRSCLASQLESARLASQHLISVLEEDRVAQDPQLRLDGRSRIELALSTVLYVPIHHLNRQKLTPRFSCPMYTYIALAALDQDYPWPTAKVRAAVFKANENVAIFRRRTVVSLSALPARWMNLMSSRRRLNVLNPHQASIIVTETKTTLPTPTIFLERNASSVKQILIEYK